MISADARCRGAGEGESVILGSVHAMTLTGVIALRSSVVRVTLSRVEHISENETRYTWLMQSRVNKFGCYRLPMLDPSWTYSVIAQYEPDYPSDDQFSPYHHEITPEGDPHRRDFMISANPWSSIGGLK